jgi:hypothetical protein
MKDNWVGLHCPNPECGYSTKGYLYDGKIDDDYKQCEDCEIDFEIIKFEDIDDENLILEMIEEEIENANYHSLSYLPRRLFNSISKITSPSDHADLARYIAEGIYKDI